MYRATYKSYQLKFKEPGGTSRGVLTTKMSYFIQVWNENHPEIKGTGECSILPGLSPDDQTGLENKLNWCCTNINELSNTFHETLKEWPAIRFALEMAFLDLKNGGKKIWFPSGFTNGKQFIPINGLIWMGNISEMQQRIDEKLASGFNCLKLKIGAFNFEKEYLLIKNLRQHFSPDILELRVDANGAFSADKAPEVLEKLARLSIHSIEQPVKSGQWETMARLCASSPVPIALDEELIGINNPDDRNRMLKTIRPQYIILKPSLTGGFQSSDNWIKMAESVNAGWWVTSALESNIGLNAIAQWTATLNNTMPQGLGTGQVFTNNIDAPLIVQNGELRYQIWNSGC